MLLIRKPMGVRRRVVSGGGGETTVGNLLQTLTEGNSAGNKQIRDLLAGTIPGDAVNLGQLSALSNYVDSQIAALDGQIDTVGAGAVRTLAQILAADPSAGGAKITELADGTAPADAATRGQLDASASSITTAYTAAIAARTLAQVLAAGNAANAKITAVTDGTAATDAVNRGQLDASASSITTAYTAAIAARTLA
ncbi:MAG TPA: hypothetical protein VFQ35_05900, partial [Polyangiaceae bacterium]|nr:hypothetical protein [Polyangiaceae bacterium]